MASVARYDEIITYSWKYELTMWQNQA